LKIIFSSGACHLVWPYISVLRVSKQEHRRTHRGETGRGASHFEHN
jgi:hypothetical protein